MKTRKQLVVLCLLGGLMGCSNMSTTEQRSLSGAAIGTAGGALIAGLTGGNAGKGALIGAAAGAAGGFLYDKHEKSQGN